MRARSCALQCKECGGGSICEHGRVRSHCIECSPSKFCHHVRLRYACDVCNPKKKCTQCPNLTRTKSGLCAACNKERKAKA